MGQPSIPQSRPDPTRNGPNRLPVIAGPSTGGSAVLQRKPLFAPPPVYRPASPPISAPAVYRPNISPLLQQKPLAAPLQRIPVGAPPSIYRPVNAVVAAPAAYRPDFAAPLQLKGTMAARPEHWPQPAIQRGPTPGVLAAQVQPGIQAVKPGAIQLGRRSKRSTWNAKQIAQNERLFRRRAERQERYARAFAQERDVAQKLKQLEDKFTETGGDYHGTLFSTTSTKANLIGQAWVGAGAVRSYYGASAWNSLVSSDGGRQYRPPMLKKYSGTFLANYEAKKDDNDVEYQFNAHVTIINLEAGEDWEKMKKGQERP